MDYVDSCLGLFFQAEDGIRDLVRSRGLGDVYKRQAPRAPHAAPRAVPALGVSQRQMRAKRLQPCVPDPCLLYTSDAADERSSVDLGGRRIIKKKKTQEDEAGTTDISETK